MAYLTRYRTTPAPSKKMPGGIPYIIGNEAAERFSFYGMKGILVVFMTKHLMERGGELAPMSEVEARTWYHMFTFAVYLTPLFGALLADIFLGKYRTIIGLSIVYVLGHLALAMDDTRLGLAVGLGLIAVGAGGIKPCVSAHVGDQFGRMNSFLLPKVFSWFYFSINLGAMTSTLLTPLLLHWYGPNVAFGVPGMLMLLATVVFWMGRRKFVHIPPGGTKFVRETFGPEGLRAAAKLAVVFVFVAMFWALFDQTGSAWVLQADKMNLSWLGIEWLPAQIQAANPLMVMLLIPVFAYGVYPAVSRVFPLTPMRRISIGLFLAGASFAIPATVEGWIARGATPSIAWQILAYLVITSAEVMVSITALEFAYTQAPRRMKSFIMSLYMLSVSLGNLFVAGVNYFIQNADGTTKLEGASYYWFFTGLMFATALLFVGVAAIYRPRDYIQGDEPEGPVCPGCGYSLAGLGDGVCPECGLDPRSAAAGVLNR